MNGISSVPSAGGIYLNFLLGEPFFLLRTVGLVSSKLEEGFIELFCIDVTTQSRSPYSLI